MEVKSKIHVADSEMREYYDAHHGDYSEEDVFHARHIFFRTSENAPPEQIKTTMSKALLVMSEARTGKDFAELAKKYSEDPAARNNGGDLGSFKKGEMQAELEQAIISLQPGEVSEPTPPFRRVRRESTDRAMQPRFDQCDDLVAPGDVRVQRRG